MEITASRYLDLILASGCRVEASRQAGKITVRGPKVIVDDDCFRETTLLLKAGMLPFLPKEM